MSLGLLFIILYWIVFQGDISGLLTVKSFLFVGALSLIEQEIRKWKK